MGWDIGFVFEFNDEGNGLICICLFHTFYPKHISYRVTSRD